MRTFGRTFELDQSESLLIFSSEGMRFDNFQDCWQTILSKSLLYDEEFVKQVNQYIDNIEAEEYEAVRSDQGLFWLTRSVGSPTPCSQEDKYDKELEYFQDANDV